jgi:hypothetical protein
VKAGACKLEFAKSYFFFPRLQDPEIAIPIKAPSENCVQWGTGGISELQSSVQVECNGRSTTPNQKHPSLQLSQCIMVVID